MKWDRGRWRRWSGRRWASATYSVQPARLRSAIPFDQHQMLPAATRERILTKAVDAEVLAGATVVRRTSEGVILGYVKPVNHLAHFLMTLITGGLWGIVWLVVVATKKQERIRLDVDLWGNVWPVAAPK